MYGHCQCPNVPCVSRSTALRHWKLCLVSCRQIKWRWRNDFALLKYDCFRSPQGAGSSPDKAAGLKTRTNSPQRTTARALSSQKTSGKGRSPEQPSAGSRSPPAGSGGARGRETLPQHGAGTSLPRRSTSSPPRGPTEPRTTRPWSQTRPWPYWQNHEQHDLDLKHDLDLTDVLHSTTWPWPCRRTPLCCRRRKTDKSTTIDCFAVNFNCTVDLDEMHAVPVGTVCLSPTVYGRKCADCTSSDWMHWSLI